MPAATAQKKSIYLIGGSDEFTVKETAIKLADKLAPKNAGEFGLETIEGTAANQDEALKILSRLNEAINTVGFFGAEKLIWLKSTNLLADEKGVSAEAVKDGLTDLADQLKKGLPDGVTLLISAVGLDRRRVLCKTLEKIGEANFFDKLEAGKRDGDEDIATFIQQRLRQEKKAITSEAFAAFRDLVAPDLREIANELEKLCLYVGKRTEIHHTDVATICSASRQAVIWELTDSLGSRHLTKSLAALDNLLSTGEEPIGVLMMLVSQFRLILLAKDLMQRKVLVPRDGYGGAPEYANAFPRLPETETGHFPRTKEGNLPSGWRLYKCALAAKNFSTAELIHAMDLLIEANRQLVSTQLDKRLVLEETLTKIARKPAAV